MAKSVLEAPPIEAEHLQEVYNWVDEAPLSRPKKNIARDFSDGVLAAEVVKHFMPGVVDLHNYSPASSFTQKLSNWNTLNMKAFRRIGFQVARSDVEKVIRCEPMAAERVLKLIKDQIEDYPNKKAQKEMQAAQVPDMAQAEEPSEISAFEQLPQDQRISELRETIEIMELKVKKLEQLVKLKDAKITALSSRLR